MSLLLEALRSATEEDLVGLELEELEVLVRRGNAALVAKEVSTLEQSVKLNVGGTYFSTSVENLTREPGTFFSVMLSGKGEVKDAVFVDRDPALFGRIVNYMRTGEIDLNGLSPQQLGALREEAGFYQIVSLLESLPTPTESLTFAPKVNGSIQLSEGNARVARVEGGVSYAISLAAFSPSLREIKVRLIKGMNVVFGVAPKSVLDYGSTYSNCGWYLHAYNGSLYSQNGDANKPFGHKIDEGSVVTVKLDEEFNVLFEVDGEDWGVAFPKVAEDYSVLLHLVVGLYHVGDAVEMLL